MHRCGESGDNEFNFCEECQPPSKCRTPNIAMCSVSQAIGQFFYHTHTHSIFISSTKEMWGFLTCGIHSMQALQQIWAL